MEPFYAGLEGGKNQNWIAGLNVEVVDPGNFDKGLKYEQG